MPGRGGGGGAPALGMGGGGGGPPDSGMGGGGGGGAAGDVPRGAPPSLSPNGADGTGGVKGADGTAGEALADLSPVADKGRGGPMEPKSREASWAAPAAGRSSSESSESDSSLPEPHSSSVSGRFLETLPVGCGTTGAAAVAGLPPVSWVMRWKGFVDTSA